MSKEEFLAYSSKQETNLFVLVVAFDSNGNYLLINNKGRNMGWELPGGSVEPGENFLEAAFRRTLEETGFQAKKMEPALALKFLFSTRRDKLESLGICYAASELVAIQQPESKTLELLFSSSLIPNLMMTNKEVIRAAQDKFLKK